MYIPISRRDFVQLTGALTVGAMAGGFLSAAEAAASLGSSDGKMQYAGRDLPLLYAADCCVVGGGPSGTAAAINAARHGAKTALIERGTALGVLQTLGLVLPFMPTYAPRVILPMWLKTNRRCWTMA